MKTQVKFNKIRAILLLMAATTSIQNAEGQLFSNPGIITQHNGNWGNIGIKSNNPQATLHIGLFNPNPIASPNYLASTVSDPNREGLSIQGYNTYDGYRRYIDLAAIGTYDGTYGGSAFRFLTNDKNSDSALERMRIDRNGNIGIKSNSPQATLHIGLLNANPTIPQNYFAPTSSDPNTEGLSMQSYNTFDGFRRYVDFAAIGNQNGTDGGSTFRFLTNDKNSGFGLERMRIDRNGNVSINRTSTSADATKLQVHNGNIMISGTAPGFGGAELLFSDDVASNLYPNGRWGIEYNANAQGLNFWKPWNPSTGGGSNYHLFLTDNGKVGIGIDPTSCGSDAFPGNYKLYVKEGILTEKIKVAVQCTANWADYVFADDYILKSLNEVEEFIKANNHLPGIPSASNLVNEGLDLGEMQARQMEKIEELTLYIIAMNKQNEMLQKEVSALKAAISNIKN